MMISLIGALVVLLSIGSNGQQTSDILSFSEFTFAEMVKPQARSLCPTLFAADLPGQLLASYPNTRKIPVHIHFTPLRLVDDLTPGIMKLHAHFNLKWGIPGCPTKIDCRSIINSTYCDASSSFYVGPNEIWSPKLTHVNAASNPTPFKTMPGDIKVVALGDPIASRNVQGLFTTKCGPASLKRFPFDYVTCSFVFDSEDWRELVEYTASVSQTDSDTLVEPKIEWWVLEDGVQTKVEKTPEFEAGRRGKTRITFSISFKRNCKFYVGLLFAPIWGLFWFQIGILANLHEHRYHWSMMLVVGYTVLLGSWWSNIPKINEPNYAYIMFADKFCYSCFMTGYQTLSQVFGTTHLGKKAIKLPVLGYRTLARTIDIIVFAVATGGICIMDICLFCLMNGTQNYD